MLRHMVRLLLFSLPISISLLVCFTEASLAEEPLHAASQSHQALAEKYLCSHDFKGAVEELGQAIAMEPESAEAHALLGFAYMSLGRLEEANESLSRALGIDPRDEMSLSYLAQLYYYTSLLESGDRHGRAKQIHEELLSISHREQGHLLDYAKMESSECSKSGKEVDCASATVLWKEVLANARKSGDSSVVDLGTKYLGIISKRHP